MDIKFPWAIFVVCILLEIVFLILIGLSTLDKVSPTFVINYRVATLPAELLFLIITPFLWNRGKKLNSR